MGWNTLVLGPPGVGKTSLLNRFAAELENGRAADPASSAMTPKAIAPLQVTGQPTSAYDFLLTLEERLIGRLEEEGITSTMERGANSAQAKLRAAGLPAPVREAKEQEATGQLLTALKMVGTTVHDLAEAGFTPVFIVDELVDSTVAHTIFGRMRDELWQLGATWIVAGRSNDKSILLGPPADAFFESALDLRPFSPSDSEALILTRCRAEGVSDLPSDQIAHLVGLARGYPLLLLLLLREVLAGTPLSALEERQQRLSALLGAVSPPARRLAEVIRLRREPARATDPELQEEMGWSVSRMRQVLTELERAGVLELVDAPSGRPGRPSKAYVLAAARL